MSVTTRVMQVPPDRVWEVLADGWLYPLWVVGASRMRDVDESWPEVGSKLHHSVGNWPVLIDDYTEVLECLPQRKLLLRARAWPAGEAHVGITLTAAGAATEVEIDEDATSGPGALIPEPVKGWSLTWRNTEALRRLAFIAENRT